MRKNILLGWIAVQSERMRTCTKKVWGWLVGDGLFVFVLVMFLAFVILGVLLWCNWQWAWEPRGEPLRNLALILLGVIGLPLAIWRSIVAHRQTQASLRQAQISYEQTQISERGFLNERYQKGAEMLGSETLATRMGGIYALERLDREHPNEYHLQIMDRLCAFIRHPIHIGKKPKNDSANKKLDIPSKAGNSKCPPDIDAALTAIMQRSGRQIDIEDQERKKGYWFLDLTGANLSGLVMFAANFSYAQLSGANLSKAALLLVDLSHANLSKANLSGADIWNANLSNSDLSDITGLTQAELDNAHIQEYSDPPILEGAVCGDTGEPLVWRGEVRPNSNAGK